MVVVLMQPVGLGKIAKLINAGQIDSHELITMKTLKVWSHSSLFYSHVSLLLTETLALICRMWEP